MKVVPIIISYNEDIQVIKKCLLSFSIFPEVIFINNGLNETISKVVAGFSNIRELIPEKNLGYSNGIMLARKEIDDADYILIANADLEFSEKMFADLLDRAQLKKAAVSGFRLLLEDGSDQVPIRRFPTFFNLLATLFKVYHLFPKLQREYFYSDKDLSQSFKVDTVMGAFMLTEMSVFDAVGGFDTDYFLWYEEIDFQKKVKEYGGDIWYFGDLTATHLRGHSFAKVLTFKKQRWLRESILHYSYKWLPRYQYLLIFLLYPFYFIAGALAAAIKRS